MIATYKLHSAITVTYNGIQYAIPCIESPSPKQGAPYESGLGNDACFIQDVACVLLCFSRVRRTLPVALIVCFSALFAHMHVAICFDIVYD